MFDLQTIFETTKLKKAALQSLIERVQIVKDAFIQYGELNGNVSDEIFFDIVYSAYWYTYLTRLFFDDLEFDAGCKPRILAKSLNSFSNTLFGDSSYWKSRNVLREIIHPTIDDIIKGSWGILLINTGLLRMRLKKIGKIKPIFERKAVLCIIYYTASCIIKSLIPYPKGYKALL